MNNKWCLPKVFDSLQMGLSANLKAKTDLNYMECLNIKVIFVSFESDILGILWLKISVSKKN